MSHVLGVYLWKEWRDQRAGLLRLLVALAGLGLCALLLPPKVAGDELFVAGFAGVALVAFALSVGSDLLAGELARDRVRFLERLPGGLSAAFAGKLLFLAASAAAVTLLGLLLALCVSRLRAGALPAWPGAWSGSECVALLVLCAAALAWTFATSTWVPRSALALPVGLALLALLGWPLWLFAVAPWYAPAAGEVELCALACLLGAPFSAWASFALGYRHGGGPGRALAAGSAAAALALLPSWAWTGARALELRRLDPSSADFRIVSAVVGESERYLFATCMLELPYSARMDGRHAGEIAFAVVVDLAEGTWDATRGASFRSASFCGPSAVVVLRHQDGQRIWLDARTAQPVREPGDAPPARPVLPSAEQLGLAEGEAVLQRRGLGYLVTGGIHDPFRGRTFTTEELCGTQGRLLWFLVREGDWVAFGKEERRWLMVDPETGERSAIAGLRAGEGVGAVAPDGRLVVSGGDALLTPETGARQPLAFDDGYGEPVHITPIGTRPDDPSVLLVSGPEGFFLARLDLERALLRRAAGATGLVTDLGGPDSETAYVIEDQRRVVRVTFGTDEREVVFPR